jgi:hypothetical protein
MHRVVALALIVVLASASRADAWGFAAHRFIADRVIALLPAELRPLFEAKRAMFVERSIDPDTWRNIPGLDREESPNHFVDLDWEGYGPYPFNGLPRDYTAAVAKFGRDRIMETGTLPWRVEEIHANLRRAFEDYARRGSFGQELVVFTAAWLTHYISDAEVPFHATINHDGQLTGQNGLHSRFEATQFERFQARLTIAPKPIAPIRNPREWAFETLLASQQLVAPVLKADFDAIGSRDVYDDAYYEAFFKNDRAILEQRINESIAAVAAGIAGAWEAAGKPPVPLTLPNTPQRRRR